MMKTLAAVAALATMSLAKKKSWFLKPKLIADYDFGENLETETDTRDFLGLIPDVKTTIKHPISKSKDCEGWEMAEVNS